MQNPRVQTLCNKSSACGKSVRYTKKHDTTMTEQTFGSNHWYDRRAASFTIAPLWWVARPLQRLRMNTARGTFYEKAVCPRSVTFARAPDQALVRIRMNPTCLEIFFCNQTATRLAALITRRPCYDGPALRCVSCKAGPREACWNGHNLGSSWKCLGDETTLLLPKCGGP